MILEDDEGSAVLEIGGVHNVQLQDIVSDHYAIGPYFNKAIITGLDIHTEFYTEDGKPAYTIKKLDRMGNPIGS